MFTRREALFHFLRCVVSGGFLVVAWGYVKGSGPSSVVVTFDKAPLKGEVTFKDGVYIVGSVNGLLALSDRCPHLGCRLTYNAAERRFKCPCHGSLFTQSGRWLKGPAKKAMTLLDIDRDNRCGACKVTLPFG